MCHPEGKARHRAGLTGEKDVAIVLSLSLR